MSLAPLPITHLDHDEIVDLHDGFALTLRAMGLSDWALDKALAAAFRAAVVEVQTAREFDEQRRETIRPV